MRSLVFSTIRPHIVVVLAFFRRSEREFKLILLEAPIMSLTAPRFPMVVLAFSSLGPGVLWAAALQAGAAKATITPDVKATKVYMAGFDNNRVATGVHDDLYVRCLALGAGRDACPVRGGRDRPLL